jgi:hypothetical protein
MLFQYYFNTTKERASHESIRHRLPDSKCFKSSAQCPEILQPGRRRLKKIVGVMICEAADVIKDHILHTVSDDYMDRVNQALMLWESVLKLTIASHLNDPALPTSDWAANALDVRLSPGCGFDVVINASSFTRFCKNVRRMITVLMPNAMRMGVMKNCEC